MCHDINRVRLRHGAWKEQKSRTVARTHLRCWKRCDEGSSQIRTGSVGILDGAGYAMKSSDVS